MLKVKISSSYKLHKAQMPDLRNKFKNRVVIISFLVLSYPRESCDIWRISQNCRDVRYIENNKVFKINEIIADI